MRAFLHERHGSSFPTALNDQQNAVTRIGTTSGTTTTSTAQPNAGMPYGTIAMPLIDGQGPDFSGAVRDVHPSRTHSVDRTRTGARCYMDVMSTQLAVILMAIPSFVFPAPVRSAFSPPFVVIVIGTP